MRKGSISQITEISESTCFLFTLFVITLNMTICVICPTRNYFCFGLCRLYYKMSVFFEGLSLHAIESAAAAFPDALI